MHLVSKKIFQIKDYDEKEAEVVNSLAKWKRLALADYGMGDGFGIYTDIGYLTVDRYNMLR